MSIVSSDILIFSSALTASSGGTISTTQIVDDNLNNLFPDITGDQAAAGVQLYKKVFIQNSNVTLTFQSVLLWLASVAPSSETIALAVGTSSDSNPLDSGLVYTSPITQASAIALGSILPLASVGIWIQKTTTQGATSFPVSNFQLAIKGQTL